jgi:hypothetical protein
MLLGVSDAADAVAPTDTIIVATVDRIIMTASKPAKNFFMIKKPPYVFSPLSHVVVVDFSISFLHQNVNIFLCSVLFFVVYAQNFVAFLCKAERGFSTCSYHFHNYLAKQKNDRDV